MTRAIRQAITLLGVGLALWALPSTASGALPDRGAGPISDDVSRIAMLSADRSSVEIYSTRTGNLVGRPVPLPLRPDGQPYLWRLVGLVDGEAFLSVRDGSRAGGPDRFSGVGLAVTQTSSGTLRVLCGITAPAPCASFPDDTQPAEVIGVGPRWMIVSRDGTRGFPTDVLSYDLTPTSFTQRLPTIGQSTAVNTAPRTSRDGPIDLDDPLLRRRPRWGYHLFVGKRIHLGQLRDRQLATLRARPTTSGRARDLSVGDGVRGACINDQSSIVLWDKSTRRVWRRTLPTKLRGGSTVVCTRETVLASRNVGAFENPAKASISSWAWPTEARPSGWQRQKRLSPGSSRTI